MAEIRVGESLLYFSMQALLATCSSTHFIEFYRERKLNRSMLQKLRVRLHRLRALLNDAEDKANSSLSVEAWLVGLQDAVYGAEDLLDEISTASVQLNEEIRRNFTIPAKVGNTLLSPSNKYRIVMDSKIRAICQRLEYFERQGEVLRLQIKFDLPRKVPFRTPTTSLVNETVVVGRIDEKEKLMNMLLSDDDANRGDIDVLTIVGLAGVGKTTLAQLLYNDKRVQEHFDLTAWVCVSDDFDLIRITETLSITSRDHDGNNPYDLQVNLKERLRDKKFLIVLDDLLNVKPSNWDTFRTSLSDGKTGSRIIITTRLQRVAERIATVPICKLEPLSDEDCWSLLATHAFGSVDPSRYPDLEVIAKEIAKRCAGLPIVMKRVGGILSSNVNLNEWNKILHSEICHLSNDELLSAFRLSYIYLPSELKRCFAYCSIFPKDYLFDRKQLVLLWMAEGLVQKFEGEKTMEEIGDGYFSELLSSSLIQHAGGGMFVMHDLANDLCASVSRKRGLYFEGLQIPNVHQLSYQLKRCLAYCSKFPKDYLFDRKQLVLQWMAEGLVQEFEGEKIMEEIGDSYFSELLSRSLIQRAGGGMFVMHELVNDLWASVSRKSDIDFEGHQIQSNVCHLSYQICEYDSFDKFSTFYQLKYLRCFLPLSYNHGLKCYLAKTVLYDLLPTLTRLRVLSLSQYCNITELPSSIGNLVHLRYLDLSYTAIGRLPDATCTLHNLQTLLLLNCELLTELPAQIGKLVNLRHLDISGTNLKGMPVQINELQNLRTLTLFVVGKQPGGLSIRELRNFPHLQGKLSILKLQNVVDATDAFEADLMSKAQIEELMLEWDWNVVCDTLLERDVLDQLQPSTNLRKLTISYYGGTFLSSWLGDYSYINLVSLCINQCKHCYVLPPFGQLPSLEKLEVKGMASINTIGAEFYGSGSSSFKPFPVLKSLTFMCMPEWEEWIPFESEVENFPFPCLERLCLVKCPKLRGYLSNHLPASMIEVEISHCDQFELSALCQVSLIEKLSIVNKRLSSFMLFENDSRCSVSYLNIEMCDSLPSLPEMFLSNNCLHHLCLNFIPSLVSFPVDGLPTSLRSLKIWECKKLQFLPHETLGNYKSLERLELWNSCHSMISFPLGSFPVLKYLEIISSPELEFFTISDTSAHYLFHLETLEISDCPNLESFPQGGLPAPNLVKLSISHCHSLKSLPECIGSLTALQDFTFSNLLALTSFPEGGLPSNLQSLVISDIGRLSPTGITEWGFQRLNSLTQVRVGGHGGDDLLKAFLEKQLLSTSLVSLCISNLSHLRFLEGDWLQKFTSLQKLHIENCPKLEFLPEDSLPLSLTVVSIFRCPILEARYQDRRQEHWSKIAHIPVIVINEEVII